MTEGAFESTGHEKAWFARVTINDSGIMRK